VSSPKSDESLLSAIYSEADSTEQLLEEICTDENWQQSIEKLVMHSGGTYEDAEDIFQEGLRRMLVNIRHQIFEGRSSLKTYHYSICRNLWISQLRRDHRRKELLLAIEFPTTHSNTEQLIQHNERKTQLAKALSLLKDNCRMVLELWSQGYSMKEIARLTDYKNAQVAKKRKRICLKKLIKAIQSNPELMKTLLEL